MSDDRQEVNFEVIRKMLIEHFEKLNEDKDVSINKNRAIELMDSILDEAVKYFSGTCTGGEFTANCLRYARNIDELAFVLTNTIELMTLIFLYSKSFGTVCNIMLELSIAINFAKERQEIRRKHFGMVM